MRNRLALLPALALPSIGLASIALAAACGAGLAGCTGEDAVTCTGAACNPGDGGPEAGASFDVTTAPSIALVQGSVVQVDLTIPRAGFDGPINATATGLPPGVAAQPLVIPAGATTGKLTLSALLNAPQGSTAITLSASDLGGAIRVEHPATLLVRGSPGSPDTTFGTGGKVDAKIGVDGIVVRGVAVQSDGRILVGGQSERDFVVVRLDTAGASDTTYGQQGKVTADLRFNGMTGPDLAEGIALAPSGKAFLAGWTVTPSSNYAVARFTTDGALDLAFNTTGYVVTPFTPVPTWNGDVLAQAVVVQPDGKPVLCGEILEMGASHHPVIARLKDTGTTDDTFGTNQSGFFYRQAYEGGGVPANASDDECNALALGPGDTIVGAGTSTQGGKRFFVVRLDKQGQLDPTFGSGGFTQIAFPTDATAHSVQVLADGRVLVTGVNDAKIVVARLDAKGILDTSFGGTGKVTVDVGTPILAGSARSVLDSSGRLVFAAATGAANDVVVARILDTGTLDTSFGSGGHITAPVGTGGGTGVVRLAQQPDGRIVVATNLAAAGTPLELVRFWP